MTICYVISCQWWKCDNDHIKDINLQNCTVLYVANINLWKSFYLFYNTTYIIDALIEYAWA